MATYKYAILEKLTPELSKAISQELNLSHQELQEKGRAKINDSNGFSESELRLIASILECNAFELFTKEAIDYYCDAQTNKLPCGLEC